MARKHLNLAGVLDDVVKEAPVVDKPKAKRQYALVDNPETTLVGANLPARYARNIAMLHAETGKSKKEIVQEALDMYFTAKGGNLLKH